MKERPQQKDPPQIAKTCRSGIWNLISLLILILAATYAWPSILATIKTAAFEGAKAGVEAAVSKAMEEEKKETEEEIKEIP